MAFCEECRKNGKSVRLLERCDGDYHCMVCGGDFKKGTLEEITFDAQENRK